MTVDEKYDPIWFNPPKFWAATKQMSREDANNLLNEVIFLAEIRDLEALRKFDFVSIEPHRKRSIAS